MKIVQGKPFGFRTFFKGDPKNNNKSIKIFVNKGIGYVNREEIKINAKIVDEHKVIVPYAFGSGNPKSDRLNQFILLQDVVQKLTW